MHLPKNRSIYIDCPKIEQRRRIDRCINRHGGLKYSCKEKERTENHEIYQTCKSSIYFHLRRNSGHRTYTYSFPGDLNACGYANAQYNRLEHGLLGNGENDDKKLLMLKHSLESAMQAFNSMHKDISCNLDIRLASTDEVKFLYPKRKIVEDTSNDHILVSGNFNSLPLINAVLIIVIQI